MKELCLISPAFAFPIGERDLYYPHGELARALYSNGIKTTIVCLGPNIVRESESISIHAVPIAPENSSMLASWMPSNSYYLRAASALWRQYEKLSQSTRFDLLDVPSYLPFDAAAIAKNTALVVRSYQHELDGLRQRGSSFPVDRIMLESMQALALLNADAVLVEECVAADSNRWSHKLRNAITAKLMSQLEAAVFSDDKPILPQNDLATIMVATSATDSQWSLTCLEAVAELLRTNDGVRFILPVFQRSLSETEAALLERIKQKLRDKDMTDRLYLIQPLAINKLNGCIRSVDAVVAPVDDSGLPCTGMEALAAGKAVIVASSHPLAKFIELNDCGEIIQETATADQQLTDLTASLARIIKATEAGARGKQASKLLLQNYIDSALKCYEAALESHALYNLEQTADAGGNGQPPANAHQKFLAACDRLLYDIHYTTSIRFRVKHWINRLSQKKRHQADKSQG